MAMLRSIVLGLVLLPSGAFAGSLEIAYASLERILIEHALTEGGRRYFQGGLQDTCNYAFIQEPRVSADAGRLQVRFLFAGSLGKEVAGKCVASGDNFDILVTGVPRYEAGEIFLDEMRIDGDSRVFSLFSALLERALGPMMRAPMLQRIETTVGSLQVRPVDVGEIVLGESSLTVTTNVDLVLEPGGGGGAP